MLFKEIVDGRTHGRTPDIEGSQKLTEYFVLKWAKNKKPTSFHFFALKTDNLLFCHRDIPTIQNGYCVSNAVDYAKKKDVLLTIYQLN